MTGYHHSLLLLLLVSCHEQVTGEGKWNLSVCIFNMNPCVSFLVVVFVVHQLCVGFSLMGIHACL